MDATRLHLSVRLENATYGQPGARHSVEAHFHRASDNVLLIRELLMLWRPLIRQHSIGRIKKISITLHGLVPHSDRQIPLFWQDAQVSEAVQRRYESLSGAMDALNQRFGRDTVSMGSLPRVNHRFTGTKVAFSRIPEQEEFYE